MSSSGSQRRLPAGAELVSGGVEFRVWAPKRSKVEVVFEGDDHAPDPVTLEKDGGGYFRGVARLAKAGSRYRFRLDGTERLLPDPASRSQPEGPHGPSEVVDAGAYPWRDASWKGVSRQGQIIYELHIGTFTPEGTWAAATEQLGELARLGVTLLEVMPIADFPGRFGWGYDGVDLFAPTRLYGTPDDARRFVDAAHGHGLGVILDVVYNHFGPDGNYLSEFSDTYFTDRHKTDWGAAINYDGEGSDGVRDLVVANARYWVEEFHFDGLRLDATQNIYDDSNPHVLALIGRAVREAAPGRGTFICAENEPQEAKLVRPKERAGYALDALWNDDFHHTARVALTGRREAYYTDYAGSPQEIISALKWGYLYQGQHYAWQQERRGSPSLDLEPSNFIVFLENHDQVANSFRGERLHREFNRGRHRALVALVLLGPSTPLLFQGEEFASSRPFLFFADHVPDLAKLVRDGRREFLAQFPSMKLQEVAATLAPPEAVSTFERCKLDFRERASNSATYTLYRDLIALRRSDPVFKNPRVRGMDGAVLSASAFVLRFFGEVPGDDRIIVVNLGADVTLARAPEPFLAPPGNSMWEELWSSEDVRYGGGGSPAIEREGIWNLPGESAVALRPQELKP
jgi:maltooligosyltrehalose trehalohydrolase